MTIWLWKISPGLHLHPMTQPSTYHFTLKPNDHIWLWQISPGLHLHPMTQPSAYYFTLKPNDPMIMNNLSWTSPSSNDSIINMPLDLETKWPCDYEKYLLDLTCIHFTSELNDQMIMNSLSWTSPASSDSAISIPLHLKTKWPYDYEKSLLDFTCIQWLNHQHTNSF